MIPRTIKPNAIFYEDGVQAPNLKLVLTFVYQRLKSILVSLILALLGSAIGAYTYRIIQLQPISLDKILNATFKQAVPSPNVLIGSLICGIIFSFVYFWGWLFSKDWQKLGKPSPFAMFIGGLWLILAFDVYQLQANSLDIVSLNINIQLHEEFLVAQASIIIALLFFIPLYKWLTHSDVSLPFEWRFANWAFCIYGWVRFLTVSFGIIFLISFLSTVNFPKHLNPLVENLSGISLPIRIPSAQTGAILAGLVIASIGYWPIRYRNLKNKLGIIRLLVVLISIALIGLIYRELGETRGFTSSIIFSSITTLLSIPFQRSLS